MAILQLLDLLANMAMTAPIGVFPDFLAPSDTWNRLLFRCTHKLDKFLRPLPKICFLILIQ